jgi:hypothetical protein
VTTYAGGLSASLGAVTEGTVGVETTGSLGWYEFLGDPLQEVPTFLDGAGLKAGQAYNRAARTAISRYDLTGTFTMEAADSGLSAASGRGMNFWVRHALGSPVTGASQLGSTPAYIQAHVPGSKDGLSFTAQMGLPQTSGPTIQPFTYRGCKITQWDFSVTDGQLAQWKFAIDGWKENTGTALVSPVFAGSGYQAGIFSFADANGGAGATGTGTAIGTGTGAPFTLGGTATTVGTAGATGTGAQFTHISGGTSVGSLVRGITFTGQTGMRVDRFGLGNAGIKKEQFQNAIPTITGTLDCEFTDRTEFYDKFKTNVTTPMQFDMVHYHAGVDASGSTRGTGIYPYRLSFILPAVKFKTGPITMSGPDLLSCALTFQAYDDGSGTNPVIQISSVGTDQLP